MPPELDQGSETLGFPDTQPKPFVFVLMPFAKEFDDTYELGIKAACAAAGAYCERVDEQTFQGSMMDRVYHQISTADLIVADMSGRNPNVFYEVGYAHALGKRVVLVTSTADDIPFDLRHYQHIVYGDKIITLRDRLEPAIGYYLDTPEARSIDPFKLLTFYVCGQEVEPNGRVSLGRRTILVDQLEAPHEATLLLDISCRNTSFDTLEITDPVCFTLSVPWRLSIQGDAGNMTITPEGRGISQLPQIGRIYPEQWWASRQAIRIISSKNQLDGGTEFAASLVRYGPMGSQRIDFHIVVGHDIDLSPVNFDIPF